MNKLTEQELIELTVVYGNRHNACRAAKELLDLRSWKKTAVMCTNELAAVSSENRKLREELAAIKGEQQPFGYISTLCVRDIHKGHSCPLYPSVDEDAGYDIPVYLHPAPKE